MEEYIGSCIESVLSQTENDLEVIVVNDGSTDNTQKIIEEHEKKDNRIRAFNKANEGASKTRLFGAGEAKGDFICFVDGDDVLEPNMLETLLKNMLNENADISHCNYLVERQNGKIEHCKSTHKKIVQCGAEATKYLIEGNFEPSLCTKLFKKEIIKAFLEEDEFDKSISHYEDFLMNYYFFKKAKKIVYEDECLYHYIKRPGSLSVSNAETNNIWEPINVKKILVSKTSGSIFEDSAKKSLFMSYISQYNYVSSKKSKKYIADRLKIRDMMKEDKKFISCLPYDMKLAARLIIFSPALYKMVRKVYKKTK